MTHDPITDFVNAMTADIIDFTAKKTFDEFKSSTSKLNEMGTFQQTIGKAEMIGYTIERVVFRGFVANVHIQKMIEAGIENSTKLKVKEAEEQQNQKMQDYLLQKDEERITRKQSLEEVQQAHARGLKDAEFQLDLKMKELDLEHAKKKE